MLDDPESRNGIVLTEYRDPVDGERLRPSAEKRSRSIARMGFAALGAEPAGQRHVEAEIVQHIGISPAIEMLALPRRQLRRDFAVHDPPR